MDEYTGPKGQSYVIKTSSDPSGNLIRKSTFDSNGYLTRKDWAGGKWETFAPFACFARLGSCSYVYKNADSDHKIYVGKVEAAGGGDIINKGGFKGEAPFSDTRVTPGPYNSGERFKDASTGFHVTKYENCGLQKPVS